MAKASPKKLTWTRNKDRSLDSTDGRYAIKPMMGYSQYYQCFCRATELGRAPSQKQAKVLCQKHADDESKKHLDIAKEFERLCAQLCLETVEHEFWNRYRIEFFQNENQALSVVMGSRE